MTRRHRALAWASALTPLVVSLAGNITWGWMTGSPILIAAGVVTPLLLVLAIERWRALPEIDSGWLWWVRTAAMSGVVVVVAGWSWLHTTALLLGEIATLHPAPPAAGLDTVMRAVETALCVLAPLAIDGLAVLSVLALAASGPADTDGDRDQSDGDPDRSADDRTGGPDRRTDAELLAVLRAANPIPDTRNAVARVAKVGSDRATRLLGELQRTADPDQSGLGPDAEPDRDRVNGHRLPGVPA